MTLLRSCGVLGISLDRRPRAEDWLLLEVEGRLLPILTDPLVLEERLGVVVHACQPPDEGALSLLAGFAAGAACSRNQVEADSDWRWAVDAASGIVAALCGAGNVVVGDFDDMLGYRRQPTSAIGRAVLSANLYQPRLAQSYNPGPTLPNV